MSDPTELPTARVYRTGLPAALDGLATVCRTVAKWHREDGEPKQAVKFERFADKLHQLSLEASK